MGVTSRETCKCKSSQWWVPVSCFYKKQKEKGCSGHGRNRNRDLEKRAPPETTFRVVTPAHKVKQPQLPTWPSYVRRSLWTLLSTHHRRHATSVYYDIYSFFRHQPQSRFNVPRSADHISTISKLVQTSRCFSMHGYIYSEVTNHIL